MSNPSRLFITFALGWLVAFASSCASRGLPSELGAEAPSSPKANEAPISPVTRSLDEDPNESWRGLQETKTSTKVDPHQHHHHGGNHGG